MLLCHKEQRSCDGQGAEVLRSLEGWLWAEGREILCLKPRCSGGRTYGMRLWRPVLGSGGKHFVSGNRLFYFILGG
jgi:hypothetical protein